MYFQKALTLPDWVPEFLQSHPSFFPSLEERVRLTVDLSRTNVEKRTGGPFGAAIFEIETGRLVSVGVNRVMPCQCSTAHAEMMAFMLAQESLGIYDLGGAGMPAHELVSSAQMCAMCLGATPWSGVRRVIYAANVQDVEELAGFDEGTVHPDWKRQLERRGISIIEGILRDEARTVLAEYKASGGLAYNGRGG